MTVRTLVLTLFTGLVAAGCSSGGSGSKAFSASSAAPSTSATTSGPSAPSSGAGTPITPGIAPLQPAAGAWYVGDLHSHSATYSDDARRQGGDPIDVTVRIAEAVGLDFLAATDHRTNDVLTDTTFTSPTMALMRGMEWGGDMHAGAFGQSGPVSVSSSQQGAALVAEIDAIIADVHAKGGVFSLNHPVDPKKIWAVMPADFDGIEVWNSQWSMEAYNRADQGDLDAQMNKLGLAQAGITNPHIQAAVADQRGAYNLQALTLYESYLNSGRRIAAVGGGDRHMIFTQGHPTTHIYARSKTPQGMLDGIREARTYVSRTPTRPLVDFTADANGDGVYEALIGDEVTAGVQAYFRVVVEGAPGGRVDVIKNGAVIFSEPIISNTHILTLNDVPASGDWYRVDVYEEIPPATASRQGLALLAAQAVGKRWSVLAALLTMVPKSSYTMSYGTLLPTIIIPDEVDMLLNASLKDRGYCRGAITSPIYTR